MNGERTPGRDEWNDVENRASARVSRTYAAHVCLKCGKTIREGAYTGRSGNYDKHALACTRKAGTR